MQNRFQFLGKSKWNDAYFYVIKQLFFPSSNVEQFVSFFGREIFRHYQKKGRKKTVSLTPIPVDNTHLYLNNNSGVFYCTPHSG